MSGHRYEPAIGRVRFVGTIMLPRSVVDIASNNPAPVCVRKYDGPIGAQTAVLENCSECGRGIYLHTIVSGKFLVPDKDSNAALDRYLEFARKGKNPPKDIEIIRTYPHTI